MEVEGRVVGGVGGVEYLDNFNALTCPIFHGKLKFDMGEISHPNYGSGHLKGSIPLLLPKERYKQPSPQSEEKAYDFLVKWADEHGLKYGTTKFRNEKFRVCIAAAGKITDVCSNNYMTIALNVLIFLIDDVQEETGIFTQVQGNSDRKSIAVNLVRDVLGGKYKDVQDLPDMEYPILNAFPLILFLMYKLQEETRVWGVDDIERLIIAMEQSSQACYTLENRDFLNECSERTYLTLRSMDFGSIQVLDVICIENRISLPEEIRKNAVFLRMTQAFCCATALLNDLMGVRNELNLNNPVNLVLVKVKRSGMSLEEASAHVLALIENELRDMVLCADQLIELYPESEDLLRYIDKMKYFCHGQPYMFGDTACASRYGVTKFIENYS